MRLKFNNNFDSYYGTGESIKIELIKIIKGIERRKIIEIFDSDGADCRESIHGFKKGKIYIFSIYKPHRKSQKLPNETGNDYAIEGCSENWLEFLSNTNKVNDYIKGKKRRKKRIYDYGKLLKRIR